MKRNRRILVVPRAEGFASAPARLPSSRGRLRIENEGGDAELRD
jgi:hypothetical protein